MTKRLAKKFWTLDRTRADEGFSLIEVLAALTLLAIVTMGAVPLFISGIRSSLSSRVQTQAKNLSQERFELMRNLPYHVTSTTSTALAGCWTDPVSSNTAPGCDYKDLLDTYYRSAVFAATSTATGGFVASNASRSADEIAAGVNAPFYRYVISPVPNFQNGLFSQVVISQFLDRSRNLLALGSATFPASYNSQNSNNDLPPSGLLGVTVITKWTIGANAKKYVVFTQIGDAASQPTTLALQSQATALRVSSALDSTGLVQIQAEAGISRSDGSISNSASSSTYAQGGFAALVPGTRVDGKYTTASAPGGAPTSGGSSAAISLAAGSPTYGAVSLGASDVSNVTAGIVADQPSVPATGTPGSGTNLSTGTLLAASGAFNFTNGPGGSLLGMPLLANAPLVTAGGTAATGQTYLRAQSGAGHFAESGATATGVTANLLPTTFAPNGLVQVTMSNASLVCKTTGTTTTGTSSTYNLVVKYYTPLGYITLPTLTQLVPLTLPDPATILVNGLTTLGSYIKDWTVTTGAAVTASAAGNSVSANLNGVLHVNTQPTKVADPSSGISIDFAVLSCLAQDDR